MTETTTIRTHPGATLRTTVIDNSGNTRTAVVTSKQFIMNRLKTFHWVQMNEFTSRISRSGIRARLTELREAGYDFATRTTSNGRITGIRLTTLPGVGSFTATPFAKGRRKDYISKLNRLVLAYKYDSCLKCGTNEDLTIDHVLPLSKGGTNELVNLQVLCRSHNSEKGLRTIDYR